MKKVFFILNSMILSLGLSTLIGACSSSDEESSKEERYQPLLRNIVFKAFSEKDGKERNVDSMCIAYDKEGRVLQYGKEVTFSYQQNGAIILVDINDSKRIYKDTLFVNNHRIDSIHGSFGVYDMLYDKITGYYPFHAKLAYDKDNYLTSIVISDLWQQKGDINEVYSYSWNHGNLQKYEVVHWGKLKYRTSYEYLEDKINVRWASCVDYPLPELNVLAEEDYLGKLSHNMVSRRVYEDKSAFSNTSVYEYKYVIEQGLIVKKTVDTSYNSYAESYYWQ